MSKVDKVMRAIHKHEKRYVLLCGNVNDIFREHGVKQTEGAKIIKKMKQEGIMFPRGDVGFLKEQIKLRRRRR